MKDLYNNFKKEVSKLSGTISGNKYLLGISGGVDSIVLFDMFYRLKGEFLFEFEVITIDHKLRKESEEEVSYVKKMCEAKNIICNVETWNNNKDKSENAARIFRYEMYKKVMNEHNIHNLVLAHHADDQTETVLMKLIRGGNIREVQSIEPKRNFNNGFVIRPFLKNSKDEIKEYAKNNNLKYFDDVTNYSDFTMRNRLRNKVVPELKKENPKILQHFTEFTEQLQTTNLILEKYFNPIFLNDFSSDLLSGSIRSLKNLSFEENILFWNIFKKKKHFFQLNDKQIKQISTCVKSKKPNMEVYLDDELRFIKDHDKFSIEKEDSFDGLNLELPMNEKIAINDIQTALITDEFKTTNSIKINVDEYPSRIVLRTRQPGDVLLLSNNKHQKLKKRMIDLKLSKKQKENALILAFDDKIVWVDGIYNISNYEKNKNRNFYLQIKGRYQ
ncbi:tRNA lysidine(34) synthetase TilS [Companilactobacillus sp. DQM5]|uniref:tRNA lysidine(34) synthetase TilS n=1 Tax=Companilactobacillus sp. DQM5 TaxID=3463359 RepID=UPI00405985D6